MCVLVPHFTHAALLSGSRDAGLQKTSLGKTRSYGLWWVAGVGQSRVGSHREATHCDAATGQVRRAGQTLRTATAQQIKWGMCSAASE
eukprot:949043-Amphidinium_carterae.1